MNTPCWLAVGLGCDRGSPWQTIDAALRMALRTIHGRHAQISRLASIDLKADEDGLLLMAAWNNWPIDFYPAAALAAVTVPSPSEVVRRHTGTPSVAEAAALLAAGTTAEDLLLEKLKCRGASGHHVTVSIARVRHPFSPPHLPR